MSDTGEHQLNCGSVWSQQLEDHLQTIWSAGLRGCCKACKHLCRRALKYSEYTAAERGINHRRMKLELQLVEGGNALARCTASSSLAWHRVHSQASGASVAAVASDRRGKKFSLSSREDLWSMPTAGLVRFVEKTG
jgi:hypothetical protein